MKVELFYYSVFIITLVFSGIYMCMWHKHFNSTFTMIFTLVPISCLGYLFYARATSLESAVIAIQITYIGGCFLQLFIVLSIFSFCRIAIPSWLRTAMYACCSICFGSILTIGRSDLFYKRVSFEMRDGAGVLIREYGIMHNVFFVLLTVLFAVGMLTIVYCWFKKKQVPRRILCLLAIPDIICFFSYSILRKVIPNVDFVPAGYCIAEALFLLIAYRVNLYDVADTVIDSMIQEGSIGYASFDFKYRYLGSNDVAKKLIPALGNLAVDQKLGSTEQEKMIRDYIEGFLHNPEKNTYEYTIQKPDAPLPASEDRTDPDKSKKQDNEKIYEVTVNYLYSANRRRGYILTFTDDTANQKYIQLLGSYNKDLQEDVETKTKHIVEMHDNLIMSLAIMVESRDNSTGGHIKRTSEGVRILIQEIRKDKKINLSDEFCHNVVKAAPMHDLGKIAVDDAVLRKPGRYTAEEYEKMKRHAAEGARVIHEILRNTDDDSFKVIAENVAHYHHERWDGSGYPEKLSKEEIPIEARIMAIADVYDALVSKRVYKEAYDFEKADRIIMEGMGTQFDPGLKNVYENARPYLEAYYSQLTGRYSAHPENFYNGSLINSRSQEELQLVKANR